MHHHQRRPPPPSSNPFDPLDSGSPTSDRSRTSSPFLGDGNRNGNGMDGRRATSRFEKEDARVNQRSGMDRVRARGSSPPPEFSVFDREGDGEYLAGGERASDGEGTRRVGMNASRYHGDDPRVNSMDVPNSSASPSIGTIPDDRTSVHTEAGGSAGGATGIETFQDRFSRMFRRRRVGASSRGTGVVADDDGGRGEVGLSSMRSTVELERGSPDHDPSDPPDRHGTGPQHGDAHPQGEGSIVYPSMIKLFREDYVKFVRWMRSTSWREHRRKACAAYLWKWYGIIFIFVTIGVLLGAKHNTVVKWLEPKVDKVKHLPAGWLVPIAILFIISFPPLVGHEVVGILCGVIYGLGVGFAILAAGTFFGELGEWFAFKACCTSRAAKFERKNQYYSALTQLIREKSFMFVLILRFSAVPGHLTTALSASAGANLFSYCAAAILTLPKQLTLVYLGVAFESTDSRSHYISVGTTLLTIVMTAVAAAYIYYQMRLLLIRQEWRTRRLEEIAARGTPQMVTLPNSTSVISLDDKLRAAGYPPAYRPDSGEGGAARYELLDEDALQGQGQGQGQRDGRRPYLHAQSSGVRDGLVRAKSLPGSGTSELELYIASLREYGNGRPTSTLGAGSTAEDSGAAASSGIGAVARAGPSTPLHRIGSIDMQHSRPRAGTGASADSSASIAPLVFAHDHTADHTVRGTTSLDMWRPVHMTLGSPSQRMSGREIADDADRFALAHGGRRPELNRLRGDSSAALLGRPQADVGV